MQLILYSGLDEGGIRSGLGTPDYSYHFVLAAFRPLLERLAAVTVVRNLAEVGPLAACLPATFLCFAPPHQIPLGLPCPTMPVFAWEFSTLPDGWDGDVRQDWRHVLRAAGQAITLSAHTAGVVRAALGDGFPIAAIPAPVWDRFAAIGRTTRPLPVPDAFDTAGLALTPGMPQGNPFTPGPVAPGGIVFTSVFNPADGRKNWHDIVTAFCWAFRDAEDATLILKIVHHDRARWVPTLWLLLAQLAPFRCRVVAIDGFLETPAYHALVGATDFYVNASHCEGLCLPLMEFMSAGRPAIAPAHTAMADYVDDRAAFVVRSGIEHNVWPHDPRDLFRTMRHRIEWDSLLSAYREAYRVARERPAEHAAMGQAAAARMQSYCSEKTVAAKLATALGLAAPRSLDLAQAAD